jgi:putative hemolysin
MADFLFSGLLILGIILINAVFVMAEIALVAAKKTRLEKKKHSGSTGATYALDLINKPESFLATVQVAITLLSILIGVYSGAAFSEPVADYINSLPYINPEWYIYTSTISYTIVTLLVTYVTVLGEIIPKRIALIYPETVAINTSLLMKAISKIFYPFVWCLGKSTRFFMNLLRIKKVNDSISAEELKSFIRQAGNEGIIERSGTEMLRRLVNLGNTQIGAIMTPRSSMVCLDLQESQDEWFIKMQKYPFNNFPLIDGTLDNLIGIVSVKTLFKSHFQDPNFDIKSAAQKPFFMPEVAKATKLMEMFQTKKLRIAIVLDEYGGIEGLVTLNDIVKTFIGEMAIFAEGIEPAVIHKRDGSIVMRGNVLIEEVMDILNIDSLPGQEEGEYRTLASFVLNQFDKMPKKGDSFSVAGWLFKVTKMENFRIAKVLIKKIKKDN